jgi:hypothetical protein
MPMRFLQDMGIDIRSDIFFAHHDLGDYVEDLIVASAASRGAMRYLLHVLESFEYAFEIFMFFKRVSYVSIAYLLAIANHVILYHNITSVLVI